MADEPTFLDWGNPLALSSSEPPPPADPPRRNGASRRTVLWGVALLFAAGAAGAFALGAFRSGPPTVSAALTPTVTTSAASFSGTPVSAPAVPAAAHTPPANPAVERSAPPPPAGPAAFHARLAALCVTTIRQEQAIGAPTVADLARWSRGAVGTMTALMKEYAAVTPPASEAQHFRVYLAGLESTLSQLRLIEAAAQAGNLARVNTLAQETTPAEAAGRLAASAGGFACHPPSAEPAEDAAAKELAHTAQVAMETYATDHNGSYAGATPKIMNSYESTIPVRPGNGNAWLSRASATPGGLGYTVTATATNGDTFSIVRTANGSIARSCTTATGGGAAAVCSAAHTW